MRSRRCRRPLHPPPAVSKNAHDRKRAESTPGSPMLSGVASKTRIRHLSTARPIPKACAVIRPRARLRGRGSPQPLGWAAPLPGRSATTGVAAEERLGAGGGGDDWEASFPPAARKRREGRRERARCSVGIRSAAAADDAPRRVAGSSPVWAAAPSSPAARNAATDTRLRTPALSRHFGVPRAVLEC